MKYLKSTLGLIIILASLSVYLERMNGYEIEIPIIARVQEELPPPEFKFGYQINNLEVTSGKIKRNSLCGIME